MHIFNNIYFLYIFFVNSEYTNYCYPLKINSRFFNTAIELKFLKIIS